MKKVLVLTAALFLMASVSQAAILEAWATFLTSGSTYANDGWSYALPAGEVKPGSTDVGQTFTIQLWIQIVPDTAAGETVASIAQYGLESTALSVVTNNSTKVIEMNSPDPVGLPLVPDDYFPNTGTTGLNSQTVPGQRTDANSPYATGVDILDGDMDVIQESGANKGQTATQRTCALNKPFLFVEENWTLEQWKNANLHLEVAASSRHWDPTLGDKQYFTQILTGTGDTSLTGNFVAGTDLFVGPALPEPATLALLGFGAVATLVRRRNKK